MKILIANDGYSAHYYIRLGLARAFTICGHETIMWQISKKPVHDAFDEFNPDIFIGQTYNFSPSFIQAIQERPKMKVICKAGEWGPMKNEIDQDRFNILFASNQEIDTILKLKKLCNKPDYVYVHYHPDWINKTHGYWMDHGVQAYSQLSAADIFEFVNGQSKPIFESDLTFIGGYWDYKARTLDTYLLPLCNKYKVKIFGNSQWPIPQYCGMIPDDMAKHALASALICPNLSEPHSQEYGFDVIERPYKLASNKCFVISDWVEGQIKLYPHDEMVYAKTPEEFHEKVEHYINNPHERIPFVEKAFKNTILNHTYLDRVQQIFHRLGFESESQGVSFHKRNILTRLGVKI